MGFPAFTANAWTLDGVAFNAGDDANGFSYLVQSPDGWWGSASRRPQLEDREGDDGSNRAPNYQGTRIVTLKGLGQCQKRQDMESLCDTLAGVCRDANRLYTLAHQEFNRELQLACELNAGVSVTPMSDGVTVSFNIQLVAVDGRKFDTAVKTSQTALAQAALLGALWNGTAGTTGMEWNGPAFPITGSVWQASSGTSGILTLDNAGTAPTPIQFTVTAPVTGTMPQPSISDFTNGHLITYGGVMVPGDVLFIDTATGLALLNGSNVSGQLTRKEMFEIPARSSIQVQFSAAGPADTAELSAMWTDAY